MLVSKKILIKRINPKELKLVGDLTVENENIFVKYRWKIIKHTVQQIEQIKAYSLVSWGLVDYEQVDILFAQNYQIKLDAGLVEHQHFVETIMEQLGQNNKSLNWDLLHPHGDKMGRDIIFKKNKIS